MQTLKRLFDHMAWADQRTLKGLQSMREAPAQAVDLYAHLLAAEHVWLRRIQQRRADHAVWPALTIGDCEMLARDNHAGFAALFASGIEERLADTVHYANSSGAQFDTPLRDILLHVTHHGMYHRGQVALLVRAAGGTPLATDYIAYVRS